VLRRALYKAVVLPVAFGSIFTAAAGCRTPRTGIPTPPPSLLRFSISRGDAEPKSVNGAPLVITFTDADSTRILTSRDARSFWREYSVSSQGELRVHVAVRGETPYVRGEGMAVIPLRPDLLLEIFVFAWSPSMDPRFHGCQCPHRVAFALHGTNTLQDSIVIAWGPSSRSHPNPPH
jgi:hypothetical protein